jgi:hypothetical protein
MSVARKASLAVLLASASAASPGCSRDYPSPTPLDAGGSTGPGQDSRRLSWTDNGKRYDGSPGISRNILTNLSTTDAIIASGGSLEASMVFSVSAENALTPGTYTCAEMANHTLHYASMDYSLLRAGDGKVSDCTFTLTQVSSVSGSVIAGTFTAKSFLDVIHNINGSFSASVEIVRY